MSVQPDSATREIDPLLMMARARVGRVMRDKWRLDVLLGVGGMAAVYAATHRNGTRAALKILHPELSTHAHIRSRFLREGRVANTIAHPGAVKVVDEDVAEDGSVFLVMELLDGESLEARAVRSGGKLGPEEVLAVIDQLLDVLAAAHERGVVHRDLKPDNVFLTREGHVKVLDFGIARLRELSTASSATRTGTSMGTPAFMPPEQARGLWDEVDARSDLWATGATMFALLSGQVVHEGRTTNEQLLSAMTKPARALRLVAPDVPRAVAELVDRALAFERDVRWPDARTMQHELRLAYERMHSAPLSTAPKLTVPPSVPDRTLPSADVAAMPLEAPADVTALPVSSGKTGISLVRTALKRPELVVIGGVAAVFALVAIVLVTFLAVRSARAPSASAAVDVTPEVTAAGAAPSATELTPAPIDEADAGSTAPDSSASGEEIVSLEDLPPVEATKNKAGAKTKHAPAAGRRPAPPSPAAETEWKDRRR